MVAGRLVEVFGLGAIGESAEQAGPAPDTDGIGCDSELGGHFGAGEPTEGTEALEASFEAVALADGGHPARMEGFPCRSVGRGR